MNMQRWTDDQVEQTMGQLLRTGVILAASVVLLGGAIYVSKHGREVPDYATFHSVPAPLRSITGTIESATSFDGQGIIQLGVLLLIATPVARVMLSVVAFAQQRRPAVRDGHALRACRVVLQPGARISGTINRTCGCSPAGFPGSGCRAPGQRSVRQSIRCAAADRFGSRYTRPLRTAHTAACVRSETPILRKMCCTCSFTVS